MTPFLKLLPFGILITGLLGSVHCAGMCGPLLLASTSTRLERILYNAGRLGGYFAIGLLFGSFGQSLETVLSPIQWSLAFLIGIGLISIGVSKIVFPTKQFPLKKWSHFTVSLLQKATKLPPSLSSLRVFFIGALSPLLPCGFLYSMLLAAVLTHNPLKGGLILIFFWLGTLPMMSFLPELLHKYAIPLKGIPSRIINSALILAGITVIGLKMMGSFCTHCH